MLDEHVLYVVSKTRKTHVILNISSLDKLIINQEFRNEKFDLQCSMIVQLFLCEFDLVRLPNSIKLSPIHIINPVVKPNYLVILPTDAAPNFSSDSRV